MGLTKLLAAWFFLKVQHITLGANPELAEAGFR